MNQKYKDILSFFVYLKKIYKKSTRLWRPKRETLVENGKCSIDRKINVLASIYMYCSARHNFLCVLPIARRPTPYSMSLRQSLDPLVAAPD